MPDLTHEEMVQFAGLFNQAYSDVYGDAPDPTKVAQEALLIAKEVFAADAELKEIVEQQGQLLEFAQLVIADRNAYIAGLDREVGIEQRHSEKRRLEIQRMQTKLARRREQVKHLHQVIDNILEERPAGNFRLDPETVELWQVVSHIDELQRLRIKVEKRDRERLKFSVNLLDVSVLVKALQQRGYNDDAIREFLQVSQEVAGGN